MHTITTMNLDLNSIMMSPKAKSDIIFFIQFPLRHLIADVTLGYFLHLIMATNNDRLCTRESTVICFVLIVVRSVSSFLS